MLHIYHSDRYVPKLPDGHRFPIEKYQLIREQLLYEGSIEPENLFESEPIAEEHILAIHDADYWYAIRDLGLETRAVRKIGFPQSATLVDRSRRSVNGTFEAAQAALEAGIGMNIAGGTHHAYRDRGEGFCILNDIAISAQFLLDNALARQILIVDLDVHQGNGNAHIFQDEKRVFTFSMHGKDNYPLRKEVSDLDIPLESGTQDVAYLDLLEKNLYQLLDTRKPDFVFFQAGVDVLETDRLGKLSLSPGGCKERDYLVLKTCKSQKIPVAVCLGGGYSHRVSDTVEAHCNTFRVAAGLFM